MSLEPSLWGHTLYLPRFRPVSCYHALAVSTLKDGAGLHPTLAVCFGYLLPVSTCNVLPPPHPLFLSPRLPPLSPQRKQAPRMLASLPPALFFFSGSCVNRGPCKPTPIHGSGGISFPGYCPLCAQTSILFVSEAALLAQGQGDFLRASRAMYAGHSSHPARASTILVQASSAGSS